MTYIAEESSIELSPVELYWFTTDVGDEYRFTSAERDITVTSQIYRTIPIKRSLVESKGSSGEADVTVSMPIDIQSRAFSANDLIQKYVFQIAPSKLRLRISRYHSAGNIATIWDGYVAGWNVRGRIATARVPHILKPRLKEEIPKAKYQTFCNNILYDGLCGVTKTSFEAPGALTISTVSADGKTLTIPLLTEAAGWASGGEIVDDATGEARMIVAHNTLTTVQIIWPFSINVGIGSSVSIFAGCNHSLDHCVTKFNNEDSFNGMPFLLSQSLNPTKDGF